MRNPKLKKSFTIIEMLVSLTIFSIVTTIALGAFVIVLKGQRNALATQAVQDNASVLIESMAREIRTGTDFSVAGGSGSLPIDPPGSSTGIELIFINAKGEDIRYRLIGTSLERSNNGGVSFQQISSNQVDITNFRFIVQGAAAGGDGMQPMITIIMGFQNNGVRPEEQVSIDISTSITQRKLDEL